MAVRLTINFEINKSKNIFIGFITHALKPTVLRPLGSIMIALVFL